jgi:hypothetical protein
MAIGGTLVAQPQRVVSMISFALFRLVFALFRLVFIAVQRIYWELNGTARQVREAEDPKHYERSAHVLDVVMERHFCEQLAHTMKDFICVHNRFENPQFIIDNEHVTLYAIDDHTATFCVARQESINTLSQSSSFITQRDIVFRH